MKKFFVLVTLFFVTRVIAGDNITYEINGNPYEGYFVSPSSDTPHGFTEFDSDRYRADADSASWNRYLEFLEEAFWRQPRCISHYLPAAMSQ